MEVPDNSIHMCAWHQLSIAVPPVDQLLTVLHKSMTPDDIKKALDDLRGISNFLGDYSTVIKGVVDAVKSISEVRQFPGPQIL